MRQDNTEHGSTNGRDTFPQLPTYGADKPPGLTYMMGGCGIAGCFDVSGGRISGEQIGRMLCTMNERENGLGSGYVAYGLFDQHKDDYCLQFFFDHEKAMSSVEEYLKGRGEILKDEPVYTKKTSSMKPPYPMVWRYFFQPDPGSEKFRIRDQAPDECVVETVMGINGIIPGAICISSGKDMAVFKGNGFSYEIADYYDLGRYDAQMWLSHSRFPTNTPGWWAGAHPISLLDWSVCHNGEITSYGVNKRFVEMNGYRCSLLTDTEVVTYQWDLLVRRHKLPVQAAGFAMAPWYYEDMKRLDQKSRDLGNQLRVTYKEAFLNGPFSILVGRSRPEITMIAMADRKKLRPLLIGQSADKKRVYAASEECAVRIVDGTADTWVANPGSPMIAKMGEGIIRRGNETEPFQGVFC
jgi:glutamate synthase domain-containing protein 1